MQTWDGISSMWKRDDGLGTRSAEKELLNRSCAMEITVARRRLTSRNQFIGSEARTGTTSNGVAQVESTHTVLN